MSRQRRRTSRGRPQGGDNNPNARANGNPRNNQGNNRNNGSGGKGRRGRQTRPARTSVEAFWGDPEARPQAAERIRPTTDPAAVPRSLGEPPLTPDTGAPHHLAVVYEEAVRAATALAAANGLLESAETADAGDPAP